MTPSRLLEDYAAVVDRKAPRSLEATTLRTRSRAALDVVAYLATSRQHGFARVQRHLAECRHDPNGAAVVDLEPLDRQWTARLARTLALQDFDRFDRSDALTLYQYLCDVHGPSSLAQRHAELFAQLLFEQTKHVALQRHLRALRLPRVQRLAIAADLANPFAAAPQATAGEAVENWLERVATLIDRQAANLGFTVADGPGSAFNRLTSTQECSSVEGPLISVIVPCFQPGEGLRTAVRSITSQTWRNVEILLVDDGSPEEFAELIAEVAASDPRVRLIEKPVNEGVYRARNDALKVAEGEFITVQDSDDWSHPQRLEWQVRPLLHDPDLLATRSRCIRVDSNLTSNHVGYRPLRANASSLLFRSALVRDGIGFFDDGVRKGADGEYHLRILARFGSSSVIDLHSPLAVVRRTSGSLSRSEFRPGWRHGARTNYRAAYSYWHERIAEGADAYLAANQDERPFPAPMSFALKRGRRIPDFDIVFLGDWRQFGGPQQSMLEEIRAALGQDLKVAIAHVEALRFMTRSERYLCEPIRELIFTSQVTHLLLSDRAEIDLLLIRYPPILQFPPADHARWRVTHTWVVANQTPSERDGSDLRYLVTDCTRQAEHLFGASPLWVPQGPTVRGAIRGLLPASQLATFDNAGVLDPSDWFVEHRPWEHPTARVGRYSRDNAMKFPETRQSLLDTYTHPDVEVSMMGATRQVPQLLDGHPMPASWTLLDQGQVPVREFLRTVDFFVYFDNPVSHEAFGRSILEAIASGCLVVLPQHFQAVFGQAAVYCRPDEAMQTVVAYHANREAFLRQVSRARSIVEAKFSHSTFVSRVTPSVTALHARHVDLEEVIG